jgi:decaprenylphospho-beta-D-erythro-pentofuranosid-2-ulose 2-reductase
MTMPRPGDRAPKIIVLGALSAIAEAAARDWASQGAHLMLCGRDPQRLETIAADLRMRGATAFTFPANLAAANAEKDLGEMIEKLDGLDVVLLAYGVLGDQANEEASPAEAQRIFVINFTSAAAWCLAAANVLETQGHGSLVVIGSVAGDRGRASNYIYGASKAGIGILTQGVAHRLARTQARAVLVKAGFVDTPMTAHIATKGILWAKPDAIAKLIVMAADRRSKAGPIIYAPSFWRWVMYVIRFMPSFIFHRLKL